MSVNDRYNDLLSKFDSVSLSDLDDLALMRRVDKKFVLSTRHLHDLFERAKNHYKILEIEGARAFSYRTKYLDTNDYQLYNMHHNGRMNRQKVRFRTYDVSDITFLEIKTKNNKGTTNKTRIKTPAQALNSAKERDFLSNTLSVETEGLKESLNNSFSRITLLSFETKERISIDYNLAFNKNATDIQLPFLSIIEVKREKANINSPIVNLLKDIRVYPRGFSKYCMGMAMLNKNVKTNTFKPNLLHIKKIENAYNIA